jgi:acylphosphatase
VTRLHAVVRGRVQGVGFRWFVRERASALGLAGWVRNREDGTVEVAAEGAPEAIDRLRELLARGPRGADVSAVDPLDDVDDALPPSFTILR